MERGEVSSQMNYRVATKTLDSLVQAVFNMQVKNLYQSNLEAALEQHVDIYT